MTYLFTCGRVPVSEALFQEVDILSPCAIGGIFDDNSIAKIIAERGILYQVEWWHNTAGVICGAEEYLFEGDAESLRKKVDAIMPANTIMSLNGAKEQGITPTEFVYKYCEDLLYK